MSQFFDLHNDLLTSNENKRKYIEENSSSKMVLALWTTKIKYPVAAMKKAVEVFGGSQNVFFAFEDLHFLNERNLEEVLELPLVYCTFAWKDENVVAGGHKSHKGLTAFGKKAVKAFSEKGVRICTSHLNERSFYAVLDMGIKCINSHCGLKQFHYHSRNLTDEQVRLLIRNNGIIGLTPVAEFLKDEHDMKRATVKDFANLIDIFVQNYGIGNLAIGTDFFGVEPLVDLSNYNDFHSLSELLEKRGYTKKDIQKIFFDNANTLVC
ncbi:MAG: membrane dipeptidase [Firmicutes bacterium]|nr:membrane dipeptidase [Bacillota bacterium]